MINVLANNKVGQLQNIIALIDGHHRFLRNNTGDTNDATLQHYVQNTQGVLANNRHFIANTAQEAQPNGDGTTEGQSLHIIGYCYAYMATKDTKYLDAAKWHFDAYVKYFYANQPIPDQTGRWICNWIVNSKEPVLSNYPIDPKYPTHSGFKGTLIQFTNGRGKIPHGAPTYGEYTDKAVMAYIGVLAWDAVNASVQAIKPDGSTDWDNDGVQYDVEWVILWNGKRVDYDGNVLSSNHPLSEIGTVQLKDKGVSAILKFNYATRQPVNMGGRLIGRNEVQHNRPLHVPLLGGINQMGNAADAEQWFADACYLLWKITGEEKYSKALKSCLFTCHEYALIDSKDRFFRKEPEAETPYTDGISYDFAYPSDTVRTYGRDSEGYITLRTNKPSQVSLEQQSVWFRMNQNSKIRTTFGGKDSAGKPLLARVSMIINKEKDENDGVRWIGTLPPSTEAVQTIDLPLRALTKELMPNGDPYLLADDRAVSEYGGCVFAMSYEQNIYGSYVGNVVKAIFPNDDAGLDIGFWYLDKTTQPMQSIVYRSTGEFDMRLRDDAGWRWYWILENTNGAWVRKELNPADMHLSYYQPDHADTDVRPTYPFFTRIDQVTLLMENSSDTNLEFSYFCINDIPVQYTEEDGYTIKYRLTISGDQQFNAKIGDCTVINFRDDSLAYTPGLIPFSNIYEEGTYQIGAWHGMPYPGYQYGFIYSLDSDKYPRYIENMVNFLYDSQQWYYKKFGVLGPGASAYIWNRWDNAKYGPPDTFTMYHWGDGTAWSGYQPRAFQGAARMWQELVYRKKTVPPKLITYTENWIRYLVDFVKKSGGVTPTDFPMESIPKPDPNDFTGHMCGLWLTGCCQAYLAGCRVPGLEWLIEECVDELQRNYVNTGIPNQIMNGSWSPGIRLETGNGVESNGMFFGFWSGEILRGLGMYILYKSTNPDKPLYSVEDNISV